MSGKKQYNHEENNSDNYNTDNNVNSSGQEEQAYNRTSQKVEMVKVINTPKKEMVKIVDMAEINNRQDPHEQKTQSVCDPVYKFSYNNKHDTPVLLYTNNCVGFTQLLKYSNNTESNRNSVDNCIHAPYTKILDDNIFQKYRLPIASYSYRLCTNGQFTLFNNNTAVCNFLVNINTIKYESGKSKYTCSVCINRKEYNVECDVADYKNLKWIYSIPQTIVFNEEMLKKYLIELIMQSNIQEENVNNVPGWNMLGDKWIYVTPDGVIGHPELRIRSNIGQHFNCIYSPDAGDINKFLEMTDVTKQNPAAQIIILYDIMSFCYTLFRDAGFVPKFLLFLHGERGTKKTSVALALTQIESKTSAEFTMKSTPAGLESGFNTYKDSVMLIDDLHPSVDKAEGRAMRANLDLITRLFGDANGKRRDLSFSREKKEQYTTAGGCIVTGEYISGLESSLSRTLFLPLAKNDVDTGILTDIQNDPERLSLFMIKFIEYVSADTEKIVNAIRKRCLYYRTERENYYSNDRYAEYRAQLLAAAEIFYKAFCVEMGYINNNTADQIVRKCLFDIEMVIDRNDKALKAQNPVTMLCSALLDSIDNKSVNVIPFGHHSDAPNAVIITESAFYMSKETLLSIYVNYQQSNGFVFDNCNSRMLLDYLESINAIKITYESGRARRTNKLEGYGNKRFVHINKMALLYQLNQ